MPRLLSVLLAIALLSSGCGAPPRLNSPDGSSRVLINRGDAIAEYSRELQRDQAAERERTAGTQQVEEQLKRDIADLQANMAASMRRQEEPRAASSVPPASAAPPAVSLRSSAPSKGAPRPAEIIRADD